MMQKRAIDSRKGTRGRQEEERKGSKGGDAAGPEDDEEGDSGGLRIDKACRNPDCLDQLTEYPKIHRHPTDRCRDHIFCRGDPQPYPKGGPPLASFQLLTKSEVDRRNQKLIDDAAQGGSQVPDQDYGILGADRHLPEDRKFIVSDAALDTWLAAHYGLTLDKIPPARPLNMSRGVHERLRKGARQLFRGEQGVGFDKNKSNRDGSRGANRYKSPDSLVENAAATGLLSPELQYSLYPPQAYKHVTYPLASNAKSAVDCQIEEDERKEQQAAREARLRKKGEKGPHGGRRASASFISSREASPTLNRSSTKFKPNLQSPPAATPLSGVVDIETLDGTAKNEESIYVRTAESNVGETKSTEQSPKPRPSPEGKSSPPHCSDGQVFVVTKPCSVTFKDESEKYRAPDGALRNRLNSEHLAFMDRQEIAQLACKQRQYIRDKSNEKKIEEREGHQKQSVFEKCSRILPRSPCSDQQFDKIEKNHRSKQQIKEPQKEDWTTEEPKQSDITAQNITNLKQLAKMRQIQKNLQFQNVGRSQTHRPSEEKIQGSSKTNSVARAGHDNKGKSEQAVSLGIDNASTVGSGSMKFSKDTSMLVSGRLSRDRRARQPPTSLTMLQLKMDERQKQKEMRKQREVEESFRNLFKPRRKNLSAGRAGDRLKSAKSGTNISETFGRTSSKTFHGRGLVTPRTPRGAEFQRHRSLQSVGPPRSAHGLRSPRQVLDMKNSPKPLNLRSSLGTVDQRSLNPNSARSNIGNNENMGNLDSAKYNTSRNHYRKITARPHQNNAAETCRGKAQDPESPKEQVQDAKEDHIAGSANSKVDYSCSPSGPQIVRSLKMLSEDQINKLVNRQRPAVIMDAKKHIEINKLMKQSISSRLRIKNEIVTSKILLDQSKLQQNLQRHYGIQTKSIRIPIYTKIQQMGLQNATKESYRSAVTARGPQADHLSQDKPCVHEKVSGQGSSAGYENMAPTASSLTLSSREIRLKDIQSQFGFGKESKQGGADAASGQGCFSGKDGEDALREELLARQEKDRQKLEETIFREIDSECANIGTKSPDITEESDKGHIYDDINLQTKAIKFDLCQSTNHKDFKDAIFWLRLAQRRAQSTGSVEAGLDYLRNGLREIPLDHRLIYNYACANEALGQCERARRFFQYAQQAKPKWADAVFGEAVNHFKLKDYKNAKKCAKMAIRIYKKGGLECCEVMQYFQAMCYKNLGKFNKARRDYGALHVVFAKAENTKIFQHIMQLILLPLRSSRAENHVFMENTMRLITHFQPSPPEPKDRWLSKYVDRRTECLNMDKWGPCLVELLKDEPFFTRFDTTTLRKFLKYGKPETFSKEELIFLNTKSALDESGRRVGVITRGSAYIVSHSLGAMTPYTETRRHAGNILGHESDNGLTTKSVNWIICYDDDTEILFFPKSIFDKLWDIQFLKTDKQIVEANIECNPLLRCLSDQSQYQIIYEDMQIKRFRPGQLICRMSKRSRLNKRYRRYYEDSKRAFFEEVATAGSPQRAEGCGDDGAPTAGKAVVSGFVKKLTEGGVCNSCERIKAKHSQELAEDDEAQEADSLGQIPGACCDSVHKNAARQKRAGGTAARLERKFRDSGYKEAEGIYIVYQGNVDIVCPQSRKAIHQIQIFENFGESKVLQQPAYEHFGDLYAGLYPANPRKKRGELPASSGSPEVPAGAADLSDSEDCTVCLFLPHQKFMNISATEIRAIKEKAGLWRLKPALCNLIADKLDAGDHDLQLY